jgi:hypothetical protein
MIDYTKQPLSDKIKVCTVCGKNGFYSENPKEYIHKIIEPETTSNNGSAWIIEDSCYVPIVRAETNRL